MMHGDRPGGRWRLGREGLRVTGKPTMTTTKPPKRLGFFTRLLDQADAAERYRLAIAQIVHAERCGFDSAWVAQHHFHEDEGGLPAPFVFLAQVARADHADPPRDRDRHPAAGAADPGGGGRRGARPDVRRPAGSGSRARRQPLRVQGVRPGQRRAHGAAGPASSQLLLDAWAGRPLPGGDRLYPPTPAWSIASGRRPSPWTAPGGPARRATG